MHADRFDARPIAKVYGSGSDYQQVETAKIYVRHAYGLSPRSFRSGPHLVPLALVRYDGT